jgi:hypothetical protein
MFYIVVKKNMTCQIALSTTLVHATIAFHRVDCAVCWLGSSVLFCLPALAAAFDKGFVCLIVVGLFIIS